MAENIHGFEIQDEFEQDIASLNFDDELRVSSQTVPEGYEIIGVYMSNASSGFGLDEEDCEQQSVHSFGFIVWRPNPNAKQ